MRTANQILKINWSNGQTKVLPYCKQRHEEDEEYWRKHQSEQCGIDSLLNEKVGFYYIT